MIYAVIDTNVLVSALITHNSLSATAKVVRLLLNGEFTPLYESSIIEEYQEVLHRLAFPPVKCGYIISCLLNRMALPNRPFVSEEFAQKTNY